ncbi:MAG: histidine phosphatase family protein, partial [Proteobacteria bacterium]|nr:histidine phosphatase family protein [Pseudomonadota bacterium]
TPTRLFVVRHGDVGGEGVLHGHVDVDLTPLGVRQMERVAERLAPEPLAAVLASDLSRSRTGAAAVARGRGLAVEEDPAFRELHMGRWDARSFRELWQEERRLVEAWWRDLEGFIVPDGESLAQLRDRVLPPLRAALARHLGQTLCLVAHGGVNRVILFDALGLPLARFHSLAQDYGCLNLVEYFPDGAAVVRLVNG